MFTVSATLLQKCPHARPEYPPPIIAILNLLPVPEDTDFLTAWTTLYNSDAITVLPQARTIKARARIWKRLFIDPTVLLQFFLIFTVHARS